VTVFFTNVLLILTVKKSLKIGQTLTKLRRTKQIVPVILGHLVVRAEKLDILVDSAKCLKIGSMYFIFLTASVRHEKGKIKTIEFLPT